MKLKKAVKKLTESLMEDPQLFQAYQSNIAMAFYDAHQWHFDKVKTGHKLSKIDLHEISNAGATYFLELLCGEVNGTN